MQNNVITNWRPPRFGQAPWLLLQKPVQCPSLLHLLLLTGNIEF